MAKILEEIAPSEYTHDFYEEMNRIIWESGHEDADKLSLQLIEREQAFRRFHGIENEFGTING